ncbi:MAG: hypothetical protein MUF81_20175 [Verrucomicrobia bacterium]|nr:hypothetical protein [Verrucomicrobiota bacterium]
MSKGRSKTIIVDEFGKVKLPWSPHARPYDSYRVRTMRKAGQKGFILTLVHWESLPTPKFKHILRVLKNRARTDVHFRQYIRHWLQTFRRDRGSFTGRIVFRHAVLAKRELFNDEWPWLEYSDDYYKGALQYPPALVRMLEEASKGPFTELPSWSELERECRAKARREKKFRDEARKAGVQGVGLKMRWSPPKPLGIWFKLG